MKILSRLLAGAILVVMPMTSMGAPVTVTQTVNLSQIGPFPTGFTTADFTVGGWSSPFPFTQASQITGITWSFSSLVPRFFDQTLWSIGGIPGVELGVNDDAVPATRTALASFSPSGLTIAMSTTPPFDVVFDLVRNLVADGAIQASLGAFENFANGVPNPFSTPLTLEGNSSRLTLTLAGEVPSAVPAPGSSALLMAAALAIAAIRRRSGMSPLETAR